MFKTQSYMTHIIAHNWLIPINYQRKNKIRAKIPAVILIRDHSNMQISNG